MPATDIATLLASYTGVAVVVGGIAWKIFKNAVKQAIESNNDIKQAIETKTGPITTELKHNGGSSLLDVVKLQILPIVKELRDKQDVLFEKVAKLEGRFDQHVEETEE